MTPAAKPYRPPFEVTPIALASCAEIMRLVGRYEGVLAPKPQPKLRRHSEIRTIRGTLAIEGNTLSLDQVTAILEGKRVIGPKREILEVQNAIEVYAQASTFRPAKERDLLRAHRTMMRGLLVDAGRYRSTGVGIVQGSRVARVAPPPRRVPSLVRDLLAFLRIDRESHALIKSAVAHYEIEFIHPFTDGNGRIGRFWQHVALLRCHPVFEFVPVESIIHKRQREYYRVLGLCDKAGNSTKLIEFSLETVHQALEEFLSELRPQAETSETRLETAREHFGKEEFSRKDYLALFKTLSTATASRDLRSGVDARILKRTGQVALARYRFR